VATHLQRERAKTLTEAAMYPASRRSRIGVVPAWLETPAALYSVQEIPCTLSTTPILAFSSSRMGPCSMCSSTKARGWIAPGQSADCCRSAPRAA
jgi:hypothetical protein